MGAKLGGSFVSLALAAIVLAVAGTAQAVSVPPTSCFDRDFGTADRVNDTDTPDPGPGGPFPSETGNYLARIDTFDFNSNYCEETAEVYGLSIVIKNPFDITGPDDLSPDTFGELVDQLSTSVADGGDGFEEYDHWTGWYFDPSDDFDENPAGFHGVSVCVWIGGGVATTPEGEMANMEACAAGDYPRFAMNAVVPGMVFTLAVSEVLGEEEYGEFCGECDDPLQIAVIAYSEIYGDTEDVFAHPEAVIGYLFEPLDVPEPSVVVLLGSALAGLAWRRRARS